MKVRDVVAACEDVAPPELAADWDNIGLLLGDANADVTALMLCIDLTSSVLDEALAAPAEMVMAYHPVIFQPLARVTAEGAPVAWRAARAGLSVYSMHTALDAAPGGTNDVLADVIGLTERRSLEPVEAGAEGDCKLVVFVPPDDLSAVAEAAFAAGAGRIGNYYDCAFFSHGVGAFCGEEGTNPAVGRRGEHQATEELRLEIVTPRAQAAQVIAAVRDAHTYEEPAIDLYPLLPPGTPPGNRREEAGAVGMGRIGPLAKPASVSDVIARLKEATGLDHVLHVRPRGASGRVETAACCVGSCGSMFSAAAGAGAQLYVTGEMRHHDALAAAAAGMHVVCLGHSNSERITLKPLAVRLRKALPDLRVRVSRRDADPFEIV